MENPAAIEDLPDELEDLEVCMKEGRAPRCVRRYRIRIDREQYVVHVTYMTGQQLLEVAARRIETDPGGGGEEAHPEVAVAVEGLAFAGIPGGV